MQIIQTNTSAKNAVIYARYSPGSQQTYQSIEGQLNECSAFAERNGITIINNYIDEHLTGTSDRRPSFLQMIEDSKQRAFQFVIVYQLDRFARNRYDSALYKNKLKKNNIRVLSARENISDDASGILMESVLEGMAEYYSAELSQKVSRGRNISAQKCKYLGGIVPFGYNINAETKHYELNKQTAPLAAEIFKDYVDGKTVIEICAKLNKIGVQTPNNGNWNKNSIHHILQNKKYIGIYAYNNMEIQNGVPAIIDIPLFEATKRRIQMNKSGKRNVQTPFLLTGKIFCGICQGSMAGESGTSKTKTTYFYYKCTNRKRNLNECDLRTVKKDTVENLVIDRLKLLLSDTNLIHNLAIEIEKHANNEELLENLALCKKELKLCELSLKNIVKAIEQGVFSGTTNNRLAELEIEKNDLVYRIATYEAMNNKLTAEQVEYWFESLTIKNSQSNQQSLIDTFIKKVVVFPDKIVIIFNYCEQSRNQELTIDNISSIFNEITEEEQENTPEKSSDVSNLVRLQGLEPWAH